MADEYIRISGTQYMTGPKPQGFGAEFYVDENGNLCGKVNFDSPKSIDWSLLALHLRELKNGSLVQVPLYDFVEHKRSKNTNQFFL